MSQLVRGTTRVLDRVVGVMWVEGEVVAVSRPGSGHLYFALSDGTSQIRAVMWRSDASRLKFEVEPGQRLLCRGKLGIYERDGKFQMYVSLAEPSGAGAEALALEQLKKKLAAEGLFAAERKRPLPVLPKRIGLVTSKHGAAVRDVIRAVQRRFPVPILIADAQVQGPNAPEQIAAAMESIGKSDCDVVIVGRGGGSASDLAAFNDERVVRAIATCPIPTVSAVGHEVDQSLSDLAADQRAATPTAAGEMVVPVLVDLSDALRGEERRLHREIGLCVRAGRQDLDRLLDAAAARLAAATAERRRALSELGRSLERLHPRARLVGDRALLRELEQRVHASGRSQLENRARLFTNLTARLEALSPLGVLQRGYSLTEHQGRVVTDAARVPVGEDVQVRVARGSLVCTVKAVEGGGD